MKNKFDLRNVGNYFLEVGKLRFELTIDFPALERDYDGIRKGKESFTASHLEELKNAWGFSMWWKIPNISLDDFEVVGKLVLDLKECSEDKLFKLDSYFKNMEIVSCLLRCVWPDKYGILSPPVENLLNIKGRHQIHKYLNYLDALKELKDCYKIDTLASVDMAIWTLANILNSRRLNNIPKYKEIAESYLGSVNQVKRISARNALKDIWTNDPSYIELACLFVETDPVIAAIFAGKSLDLRLQQICREEKIKRYDKTVFGRKYKQLNEILDELIIKRRLKPADIDSIKDWWALRGEAVHQESDFENGNDGSIYVEKINSMISGIKKLNEK